MNTAKYWKDRGKTYIEEARLNDEFYRDQEEILCAAVRSVRPVTVLEVGCGFGRLTRQLSIYNCGKRFIGVDISKDQVENARQYCEGHPAEFFQHNLFSHESLPKADVVVACEVLLHIPKVRVRQVVSKLLEAAPILVHDYDTAWFSGQRVAKHCFHHDYLRLYSNLGVSFEKKEFGPHGVVIARNNAGNA